MNGVERIAAERRRQIEVEGYDAKHDAGHDEELAMAGAAYAWPNGLELMGWTRHLLWPWDERYWKPSPDDRVRELAKAGALIAAAIDSLFDGKEPTP